MRCRLWANRNSIAGEPGNRGTPPGPKNFQKSFQKSFQVEMVALPAARELLSA
jgi:hypothetical protein